jgi:hypothetical protein
VKLFNWDLILENRDVHVACRLFTESIVSTFTTYIPHYNKVVKAKDVPWLSRNLKHAINVRCKLYRIFAMNHNEVSNRNYKEASNHVTNLVNEAKTTYMCRDNICTTLNDNSSGTKNYWHNKCLKINYARDPTLNHDITPSMPVMNKILNYSISN